MSEKLRAEFEESSFGFEEIFAKVAERHGILEEKHAAELFNFLGVQVLPAFENNILCLYPSDIGPATSAEDIVTLSIDKVGLCADLALLAFKWYLQANLTHSDSPRSCS